MTPDVANPLIPTAGDIAWSTVFVAAAALTVIAFISLLRTRFTSGTRTLLWILVIFFVPVLGSILWFLSPDRRGTAESRSADPHPGRSAR